jgi:type II secretory pathway predicted ATPase ExeA
MIKTFFGLSRSPFAIDEYTPLLEHQQRHLDVIKAHCHQGGFCLILGEPGTGKTFLKDAIVRHDPTQWATLVIDRFHHTWPDLLRLLCRGLQLETTGSEQECQTRLITEARRLNAMGKAIVPIIDDAHLLPVDLIGKLCLLLDEFPKNHCLILIGKPDLGTTIRLSKQPALKDRVTYTAHLDIGPDALTNHIQHQLELAGLPPHTFTDDAVALILRASNGTLRDVNNLCLGSLVEAVNDRTKTVGLAQVNAVLMQPHRSGYC